MWRNLRLIQCRMGINGSFKSIDEPFDWTERMKRFFDKTCRIEAFQSKKRGPRRLQMQLRYGECQHAGRGTGRLMLQSWWRIISKILSLRDLRFGLREVVGWQGVWLVQYGTMRDASLST